MSNKFVMPVKGKYRVTSPFGWRKDPVTKKNTRHLNGADLVTANPNEPILASMNGRVIKAQKSTASNGGFGYYVVIRHFIDGKYYTSLYAHMKANSIKVRVGQKVQAGQPIGILGDTGYVTGPHLHWEVWKGRNHGWSADGKGFVEPISFIEAMSKSQEAKDFAYKPTPKTTKTNPIPVHTFTPPKRSNPVRIDSTASKKAQKPEKYYIVKAGDNLTKIARENKTTVPTLKKLNNIKNANLIKVGQAIRLP